MARMSGGMICLFLLQAAGFAQETPNSPAWQAGAAAVSITPEKPIWMAGYAARREPSHGIAADIFARALALEDGNGKRIVLVATDLIGIPHELREALERRVHAAYQLEPSQFWITASHTHCGPEVRPHLTRVRLAYILDDEDEIDRQVRIIEEYVEWLEERIVSAVGEALEDLAPAQLRYSQARAGFAMNRRGAPEGGRGPYWKGPVDHDVPVLHVAREDGSTRAIAFGYACHATTLSTVSQSGEPTRYEINGDYPGFAQQDLEEAFPGAVALFLTGCGGDQNPYPRRNQMPGTAPLDLARQHGRTLAQAVVAAIGSHPQRPVEGPLRTDLERAELPFDRPYSREELTQRAESSSRWVSDHARRMLSALDEEVPFSKSYAYPVHVVRLGEDVTLVGLGGEVVVDYSLRIKRELSEAVGNPAVWVAGYTTEVVGYIPSHRVLNEGGYEAESYLRIGTPEFPAPYDPSIEERIVDQVKTLTNRP
jgi:neutral ceramidase